MTSNKLTMREDVWDAVDVTLEAAPARFDVWVFVGYPAGTVWSNIWGPLHGAQQDIEAWL